MLRPDREAAGARWLDDAAEIGSWSFWRPPEAPPVRGVHALPAPEANTVPSVQIDATAEDSNLGVGEGAAVPG